MPGRSLVLGIILEVFLGLGGLPVLLHGLGFLLGISLGLGVLLERSLGLGEGVAARGLASPQRYRSDSRAGYMPLRAQSSSRPGQARRSSELTPHRVCRHAYRRQCSSCVKRVTLGGRCSPQTLPDIPREVAIVLNGHVALIMMKVVGDSGENN